MFRKLAETMTWYRRYRNSKRKNSTFRKVMKKQFRKILQDEQATKVVVEAAAFFVVAIVLLICWVDQVAHRAKYMPWITGILLLIIIAAAISCLMRLHPIRVEASRTAAYEARKARGDYVEESDDDDDPVARHNARYATRRRNSAHH